MNFKSFYTNSLILEDPEDTNEGHSYKDEDARAFLAIDELCVIAKSSKIYHHHLADSISDYIDGTLSEYNARNIAFVGTVSERVAAIAPDLGSRSDILLDSNSIIGRMWFRQNMISFWHSTENFNKIQLKNLWIIMDYHGLNPQTSMFEFGRHVFDYQQFVDMVERQNVEAVDTLSTSQTAEAPEPPPAKLQPWQQAIHMIAPDKKADALKAAGIRPKTPIPLPVKQKSTTSESFLSFFKESPDTFNSKGHDKSSPRLACDKIDARAFMVVDNIIVLARTNRIYHHHMIELLQLFLTSDKGREMAEKQIEVINIPSKQLRQEILMITDTNRESILNMPNNVVGRLWLEHRRVSFWNDSFSPQSIPLIEKAIMFYNKNPANMTYEIGEEEATCDFDQFVQWVNGQNPEPQQQVQPWQQQVHMMSPEFKGDALKQMGVKPKPAMGAELRYARGESTNNEFQTFIKESPDKYDDNPQINWANADARPFFILDGIIILGTARLYTHYDLIKGIRYMYHKITPDASDKKLEDYQKNVYVSGKVPPALLNMTKKVLATKRGDFLALGPKAVAGRIWYDQGLISLWNTAGAFDQRNMAALQEIMKMFDMTIDTIVEDGKGKKFQFPKFQQLALDIGKGKKVVAPEPPPAKDQPEIVHMLPPELKNAALKQMGVKNRAPVPLPVKQRASTSESVSNIMQFEKLISLLTEEAATAAVKKPMSPGAACHKWARLQMRGQLTPERNQLLENVIKRSPSASTIHAIMHKKARFPAGEKAILTSKKYTTQYGMFLMRDIFKLDLKKVDHLNDVQQETFFRSLINARTSEHIKSLIATLNPNTVQ